MSNQSHEQHVISGHKANLSNPNTSAESKAHSISVLEHDHHTGPEHETHVIGGHKAAIANPNTSAEAKQHSKDVLEKEFGLVAAASEEDQGQADDENKDPSRVVGGLKAAIHNPNVSEQAKDAAIEKLAEME